MEKKQFNLLIGTIILSAIILSVGVALRGNRYAALRMDNEGMVLVLDCKTGNAWGLNLEANKQGEYLRRVEEHKASVLDTIPSVK